MLYLLEYDRDEGLLVSIQAFSNADRTEAENARIELEIALNQHRVQHEIVILEAESEDALKRTHRRYFENFVEIARSAGPRVGA